MPIFASADFNLYSSSIVGTSTESYLLTVATLKLSAICVPQYRMHPEIRTFPSEHFYNNQLVDGATLTAGSRKATFHSHWCFKPYLFFDVVDGRERGSGSAGQSLANDAEADAALDLYRSLVQRCLRT